MKFTMIGELYLSVDEARRWRSRNDRRELPEGVTITLQRHDEFDRELVRHYPIEMSIRAYEIDRPAFEEACRDFGLHATDTETGGILGGDGGIGWTPAVCFEHESDAYNGSFSFGVYVTPCPEPAVPHKDDCKGHDWGRVARAVFNTYQYGA